MNLAKRTYWTLASLILTFTAFVSVANVSGKTFPSAVYYYLEGQFRTGLKGLEWSIFTTANLTGAIAHINFYTLYAYSPTNGFITLYSKF